ncbi:MarR family transcriptional regulator [Streptomyces sp. NBC_01233]|uniref:MarR family transcriptional regulator n=1 Tax=Streptomyces sp. NBC_01233 TaxID=2903787 RepID=UPI002E140D6E|nr:MarR family transcriptional regulator [Streptomyces sp. NBC_01233]
MLLRSLRFTTPVLFALGALNAVTAQMQDDRGALATALCLCVCAGGLFVEDRLQHGLRRDRRVLAYVAAHPKTSLMGAARDLEFSSRTIEASLERLVADGLVAHGGEEATVRTYSLSG